MCSKQLAVRNKSNPILVLIRLKWRLLAVTNLKGGTDSLFFIYDDDHPGGAGRGPEDLAMLSLNRNGALSTIPMDF